MNANEITHLSDLNLQFHCFEPEPISIPLTPEEIEENEYRELLLEDQRYEADMQRRDERAERYYDDRFDNDNEDARRDQDNEDRENETGYYSPNNY